MHPVAVHIVVYHGNMTQAADNGARFSCPSLTWDLIFRVFELLPTNDIVLLCRVVCKESWRRFSQPHHRVGLPLPPVSCCGQWLPHLQQFLRQLTFSGKLQMLSAAASSCSEVNLELAWDLLSPCLARGIGPERPGTTDAGAAAVKSGHLHLLPWLLQHGCPLDMHSTLEAAAEHCDLVGLQRVWELLGCGPDPPGRHGATLYGELACTAATYGRDTIAKLAWLVAMAEGSKQHYKGPWLLLKAATGAASSGRLPVLQWLLEAALEGGVGMEALWSRVLDGEARGQPLARALGAGQVAAADWLVDEAGYPLPQQEEGQGPEFGPGLDQEQQEDEREVLWAAAAQGGSVDALRWLQRRGVAVDSYALPTAASAGHLGAVRFLNEECGLGVDDLVLRQAAGSRSIPTAQWLLQAGCRVSPEAYGKAARAGDVAMVRWLALEANCPWSQNTFTDVVQCWAYEPGNSIDDLKEAVRLLAEVGCPCNSKSGAADGAAATGRLPLLRYLHEELGVGFGPGTLAAAAMGGCEEVLEWLVGAGCRTGQDFLTGGPYVAAAGNGDVATLQCLRRLGCHGIRGCCMEQWTWRHRHRLCGGWRSRVRRWTGRRWRGWKTWQGGGGSCGVSVRSGSQLNLRRRSAARDGEVCATNWLHARGEMRVWCGCVGVECPRHALTNSRAALEGRQEHCGASGLMMLLVGLVK